MLRSESRPTPEALDDLDRLDAALRAHRQGGRPARGPHAGAPAGSTAGRDAGTDRDSDVDRDATTVDLDAELLALVADVRATRPELDAGARMRLEERVRTAKAAPARRTRPRLTADRRWRAGLALAAVVAVAVPAGSVLVRDGGSDDEVTARATSLRAPSSDAGELRSFSAPLPESTAGSSSGDSSSSATGSSPSGDSASSGGLGQQDRRSSGTADPATAVPVPPSSTQAPLDAPRQVVRDVEQVVRIAPGDVARSAARVSTIVQDAGGYLGSSQVRERGPQAGGRFEVVVPTGRLDATVTALSRIGRPVRLERSSTDVTDQAVSLDDRLADLRADRSAARLALARTVDEDRRAARRRELDLLSSRIAALQGQRAELRRQTSTSRIDLRLTTSRAAEDEPAPEVDDGSWGIGDAWRDAGRVLEVGGGVTLVGAVAVVPPAALVALGLVLRRRLASRRRDDVIDAA